MRRNLALYCILATFFSGIGSAFAQEQLTSALVLKGATLYTITNGIVPDGTLVIQDGEIVAVGSSSEVMVPDGAAVRDVSGKVILPGLVDTHSHLGVYPHPRVPANADGNETTGPVQSVVRALRTITFDAAQVLGIDARVGSLEAGKDADLVLFDGDPFEYTSHIQAVILNGQVVYQRPTVSP